MPRCRSLAMDATPEDLATQDLLALLAGSDRVREAVARYEIRDLAGQSPGELRAKGFSAAMARRIACAFELGRRLLEKRFRPGQVYTSSHDIFEGYHARMRDLKVERFMLVMLDAKNRVMRETMISQGTLSNSLVHPREVFREAMRQAAAAVIFVHNHPSGDPEPSPEDIDLTRRLQAVGELVGIRVLDHVVIGDGAYVSFLDRGWISA